MPVTPTSPSASRTSSSLNGLMIAITIFICRLHGWGLGPRGSRRGVSIPLPAVGVFLQPVAPAADCALTRRGRSWARPRTGARGMIDLNHIDDLARRLSGLVPPGLRESREELQENFKSVLQSGMSRLDLVTREEFEVQREVLLRTREKLERLQAVVAELEARQAGAGPDAACGDAAG